MVSERLLTMASSLQVGVADLGSLDCVLCPLHHLLCPSLPQCVACPLSIRLPSCSRRPRSSSRRRPRSSSRSSSRCIISSSNRRGPAADQPLSPVVVRIRGGSSVIVASSATDITSGTSPGRSLHQGGELARRSCIRKYLAVDCGLVRES